MSTEALFCPDCEEVAARPALRDCAITHDDKNLVVNNLECYRCGLCGTEQVRPDQIRRNQMLIADARRRADGLLTGHEIKVIREILSVSQSDASTLFGGGANAFSKYERGEVIQSLSMDRLLKVTAALPMAMDVLRREANMATCQTKVVWPEERPPRVSLNDPEYRSRELSGRKRIASVDRESKVVRLRVA